MKDRQYDEFRLACNSFKAVERAVYFVWRERSSNYIKLVDKLSIGLQYKRIMSFLKLSFERFSTKSCRCKRSVNNGFTRIYLPLNNVTRADKPAKCLPSIVAKRNFRSTPEKIIFKNNRFVCRCTRVFPEVPNLTYRW